MKKQFERFLPTNFDWKSAIAFSKLTGITGAAQLLIQAIGLLSGIIVIRLLSTDQYAYYTLANTMLGTMVVLADGGIAAGVMAQAGRVYQDKERLGVVLNTGLELRRKFAVGSLIIAAPVLIYLLVHQGAGWGYAILILLSLIPAFYAALSGAIFMMPFKLRQDIKPLQRNLVVESISRFLLIFSLILLPWAFIAILSAGLPRIYANIRLRMLSASTADWSQKSDKAVRQSILKMMKRLMPGAIYYCVSGQISVWLISFFGNTEAVAQIGALGRIAIMLSVINTLFATLVYPRYARLPEIKGLLTKRYLLIISALLTITVVLVSLVYVFSDQILWVLGPEYSSLNYELALSVSASSIALMSGATFTLTTHRGWAIHPGLSIPVSILAIVSGAILLNVSTLVGVLLFNIYVVSAQFLLNSAFLIFKLNTFSSQSFSASD